MFVGMAGSSPSSRGHVAFVVGMMTGGSAAGGHARMKKEQLVAPHSPRVASASWRSSFVLWTSSSFLLSPLSLLCGSRELLSVFKIWGREDTGEWTDVRDSGTHGVVVWCRNIAPRLDLDISYGAIKKG